MRWLPVALATTAPLRALGPGPADAPAEAAPARRPRRLRARASDTPQAREAELAQQVVPSALWAFFGHVYVANLPRDTVRLDHMHELLRKLSVRDYEVFPSVDGKDPIEVPEALLAAMHRAGPRQKCGDGFAPGFPFRNERVPWQGGEREAALGCYLTHLRLLESALEQDYESVLIFEDDLDPDPQPLAHLKGLDALPDDWDLLYLGWSRAGDCAHLAAEDCAVHRAEPLNAAECEPSVPGFCRLKGPSLQQTHALAVSQKALKSLVQLLKDGLQHKRACPVDQMYRSFFAKHPEWRVYAATQPFFRQLSAENEIASDISLRAPRREAPRAPALLRLAEAAPSSTPVWWVLGWGRSGTTVAMELLGSEPSSFTLYEPCHVSATGSDTYGGERLTEQNVQALCPQLLRDAMRCDFSQITLFYKGSRPREHRYATPAVMTKQCKSAKVRVVKTVHGGSPLLRADQISELLAEVPTLRVVAMVRDPRAVVASREALPGQWQDTLQGGQLLATMCASLSAFPLRARSSRVFTLQYEQLVEHPVSTASDLFGFLGQPLAPEVRSFVKQHLEGHGCDDKSPYGTCRTAKQAKQAVQKAGSLVPSEMAKADHVCAAVLHAWYAP